MSISTKYRGSVIAGNCTAGQCAARNVTIGGSPLVGITTQLAAKTRADSGDVTTADTADNYTDSRIGNTTVAPIHLNFDDSAESGLTLNIPDASHKTSYLNGVITTPDDEYSLLYYTAPVSFPGGIRTINFSCYTNLDPPLVHSVEIRPFTVNTVTAPEYGIHDGSTFATYKYPAGIDSACFADSIIPVGTVNNPFYVVPRDIVGVHMAYTTSGTSTLPIAFRLRISCIQYDGLSDDPTYTDSVIVPCGVAGKLSICKLNIPTISIISTAPAAILSKFERAGTADSNPDDLFVWRLTYVLTKISFSEWAGFDKVYV